MIKIHDIVIAHITRILLMFVISFSHGCKKEPTPELNLSKSSVEVSNSSGAVTISFTCNGKWTALSSETWLTVSPSFGTGNGELTLNFSSNTSSTERSGDIILTTKTLTKSLKITQIQTILETDKSVLSFSKESSSTKLNITSNTDWQVVLPSEVDWVTVWPKSGSNNMEVSVNVSSNPGPIRNTAIAIKYIQTEKNVAITQFRGQNSEPTTPKLKLPLNNTNDVSRLPEFRWSTSTDSDRDPVVYNLELSKNGSNWISTNPVHDTVLLLSDYLEANTNYLWRVKATDTMDVSVFSETFKLRTGNKVSYFDGEYKIALENAAGASPSEILFIGDGYTAEDFVEGGKFDKEVDEGIKYFFSIEPYKSYKQYFKVYKQAGYSRDQGVTQKDKNIFKNTKFGVAFEGGSKMVSNSDAVFSNAKLIQGIDDIKLRDLLIVLLVNEDRYAGTCFMWGDGKTIAITPVSRDPYLVNHYWGILLHEAGGHGFARLADEYVLSTNIGKSITTEDSQKLRDFFRINFYTNVDLTSDTSQVRWKHFIKKPGYERVGVYEGGFYYSFGVWRPEISSCMVNNIDYYNAPSRETIVKKIMAKAGEQHTLEKFLIKDIRREPELLTALKTKSFNPLTFVPLAPPVFVK